MIGAGVHIYVRTMQSSHRCSLAKLMRIAIEEPEQNSVYIQLLFLFLSYCFIIIGCKTVLCFNFRVLGGGGGGTFSNTCGRLVVKFRD